MRTANIMILERESDDPKAKVSPSKSISTEGLPFNYDGRLDFLYVGGYRTKVETVGYDPGDNKLSILASLNPEEFPAAFKDAEGKRSGFEAWSAVN